MGQIVFQATLGGQVAVAGPNTASSFTLTLPAATDTLVGKATTDTLTNKTLTSPTITGGTSTATQNLANVTGTLAVGNGGTGVTTSTGTGNNVLSASPTLTGTIAGASLSLSSLTSGRVTYAGASGLLTDSANLLYSGTDLTVYGVRVGRGGGAISSNTVVGSSAGSANTSGTELTFIGQQAGNSNLSGVSNVAVGNYASSGQTTGSYNSSLGVYAGYGGNGSNNTSVGYFTLFANTSGNNNTVLGSQALISNLSASNNTAVGYLSGYTNSTGQECVYIGARSGFSTTGGDNTFVGYNSGNAVTTGYANTIIGKYTGNSGGLDIRTANNYIVLSDGSGNPRGIFDGARLMVNSTTSVVSADEIAGFVGNSGISAKATNSSANFAGAFWNSATSGDNNFLAFLTETGGTGRGGITYNRAAGLTSFNTTSDYRAKDIIGPVTDSGALIDSVPVYMGKMKDATQERPMFLAHETPNYAHTGEKDAVDADGKPVYQQMDASSLIPVMWAEIQSLRKRVAQLESK